MLSTVFFPSKTDLIFKSLKRANLPYDNIQDTCAKNSFNARVIRFYGKCYQLIINNQVDTQRLILTFTQ